MLLDDFIDVRYPSVLLCGKILWVASIVIINIPKKNFVFIAVIDMF